MPEQSIRYSFGGDEHLFAEVSESMSLPAFFRGLEMTNALKAMKLPGVLDVCLANASFQIRFNPDRISPQTLLHKVKSLENQRGTAHYLDTRIIEIPVYYNDPWTHETLMRFRDRHQSPEQTDLEYAASLNGYGNIEDFILAHSHSPWFVSMVGFVAGLPFMFQMVEQEQQIEVPKYLTPRTDTPKQTVGHGGCFGCIYSVKGAGGYQMFGTTPVPIYDPQQSMPHLKDSIVFFRAGDIVKFRPIDRTEYGQITQAVAAGEYVLHTRSFRFDLQEYLADPESYKARIMEALYVN
ncbi:5-oxoprolinase subunit B family protein [Vibrio mangrovi]|uniref:Allophanate hydrolase subunit 1 n=1 Tax=Vibrio mangrovi TaxID=474394 RepID=A0A1Y6IVF5_9VIBR|nr:allophanate hydrolase subunit 1 [Vibrio mangrovi]MDW6004895.1 allophanate hydrolase subunit 1 [Vibrio mangrovi]SMS01657.1 Kinase A inhibitor [Vibrio mangrovi]